MIFVGLLIGYSVKSSMSCKGKTCFEITLIGNVRWKNNNFSSS